jgi:hypothetical protein
VGADESGARRTFELHPQNPTPAGRAIGLLARSGGTLVGAIVDGAVRTWLVDPNGQLQLLILPAGFAARFDPFELLNEHGDVVARGGDVVTVGGAHLVRPAIHAVSDTSTRSRLGSYRAVHRLTPDGAQESALAGQKHGFRLPSAVSAERWY